MFCVLKIEILRTQGRMWLEGSLGLLLTGKTGDFSLTRSSCFTNKKSPNLEIPHSQAPVAVTYVTAYKEGGCTPEEIDPSMNSVKTFPDHSVEYKHLYALPVFIFCLLRTACNYSKHSSTTLLYAVESHQRVLEFS